ncbi:hypothetical protein LTR10_013505 [Elasticomyces elasticus]|uniref:Ribosome assembly protein 3 n=1 Tax=Exophiala sideris TaxID=1016849 RepID=A0ABR0JPY1_9EURO|nr:hypothetical protein LTR10_013505 [Elasticomyces elasticus]KAK5039642.1 hypothetical protein LTS07_000136 [Exophiala sideris]KAK5041194.1 hypothetical protein LTR13_002668 [Exophiala sideris]KAK5068019.1 hypothetical protein LTR69_000136 [Exophiala sideris]KAK5187321.1 hypothetical protein LTR44_000136 [Eurotiomycetes sp. CCFEE 6388]
MAGKAKRKQPPPNVHQIIAAKRERRDAARPNWFYIAESAHPQVSAYGDKLFKQQEKLEKQSETQTTDEEKWTVIEQQLRGEMPEEFQALDTLQQHVDTFTACNPTVIEKLFAGLETEEERLAVILPHIKFPETQTEESSGLDGEDENDDSVEILYQNLTAAEVEEAKRKKKAENRRRRKENLKKRKGDPELQRAAEEARRVNEQNAEARRQRHEQREAADNGNDGIDVDE